MIIISGHELVPAKNRDRYVDAYRDLVSRARAFDGCVHIAITADSVNPGTGQHHPFAATGCGARRRSRRLRHRPVEVRY